MRLNHVTPSLFGAAILLLAVGQPVEAQVARPRVGQFEVPGLDFRPNGAWRKQTANIRARRRALIAAGNMALLNASSPGATSQVVTGDFALPVVPIYFSDSATPLYLPSDYQALLFSAAPVSLPYSLKTYYEQLSNGNITIDGTVFPWVRAPNTAAYYENGCHGVIRCPDLSRFGALLIGALTTVSSGPDSLTVWQQFDNDGPDGIPNSGDDDGVVDFVTFLHPELDGACNTSHIWSHRWVIQGVNNGSVFVTKSNRHGGGKIVINDYIMQSGQGGNSGCSGGQIMPIGTVAHETGHAFGLPDLYDTDLVTEGIGEYGLMGAGNWARPYSPSRMEGWSMLELGWVKADTLSTTGTITLNPVATSDSVRILKTQTSGEYFILENRAAVESDTAQMNPALIRAKSPGLYIWHIDQARITLGAFNNDINTGNIQGVALVQADGKNQLRATVPPPPGDTSVSNRGDRGDAFPGSTNNTAFDGTTLPGMLTNAGKVVAGRIDSIRFGPNQAVLFRYRVENLLTVTRIGTGTGTIQSTAPGLLGNGVSVTPGTVVTLTAVPASQQLFTGWAGDTTTTDSVLVLTMDRNWSVTARFDDAAVFTTEAAANDLLGVQSLSAGQRLVLDQQGNNNAVYDLGDFLHWVTVTVQTVPPALMAKLLAAAGPTPATTPKGVTR